MADIAAHLLAARDEIKAELCEIEQAEIAARDRLDDILGQRSRAGALLFDLDEMLANLNPGFPVLPASPRVQEPEAAQVADVAPPVPVVAEMAPAKGTRAGRGSEEWAEIAATARAAVLENRPAAAAVAAAHGRSIGAAEVLVSKLRRKGYDIPPARFGRKPASPAPAVEAEGPVSLEPISLPAGPPARPPAAPIAAKAKKPSRGTDLTGAAAGHANEAIAAGNLPLPAIMAGLSVSESVAAGLLRRAQGQRLIVAGPPAAVRVIDDTPPPVAQLPAGGLAEIAATYREAVEVNRRPVQTLIDRYDCTRDQANEWVGLASAAGHLPPRGEPVITTPAPARFVPRGGHL